MSTHTSTIEQHLEQIEQVLGGVEEIRRYHILNHVTAIRAELAAQAKQTNNTKHEEWSNYETWVAYKWIKSQDHESNSTLTTAWSLINTPDTVDLRGWLEAQSPLSFDNDVHANLLQSAINRINFAEIAERLIADSKTQSQEAE